MIKNRRNGLIAFLSLFSIVLLVLLTSPSVENVAVIFLYFSLLTVFLIYSLHTVLDFLGVSTKSKSRLYVLAFSVYVVSIQLLATFRALRMAETLLLTLTFALISWFLISRNSK